MFVDDSCDHALGTITENPVGTKKGMFFTFQTSCSGCLDGFSVKVVGRNLASNFQKKYEEIDFLFFSVKMQIVHILLLSLYEWQLVWTKF